jgi:hypothetical protein
MCPSISPNDAESLSDVSSPDFLQGLISEEEYARRRGVTVRTCQRDRQLRKSPPYIQLGRRIYYRTEGIREWLARNERANEPVVTARRSAVRQAPRSWAGGRS